MTDRPLAATSTPEDQAITPDCQDRKRARLPIRDGVFATDAASTRTWPTSATKR